MASENEFQTPFTIRLSDGNTLTGIHSATATDHAPSSRKKVVLVSVHGGTYNSSYFAAHPTDSLLKIANSLSIPVIAIDRPGYGGSSPLEYNIENENDNSDNRNDSSNGDDSDSNSDDYSDDDSDDNNENNTSRNTYIQKQGDYLTRTILPSLWEQFREKMGFDHIVVYGHGVGALISLVCTSVYSQMARPAYSFVGLAVVGAGDVLMIEEATDPPPANISDTPTGFPFDVKDRLMLNHPEQKLVPEEVLSKTAQLDHPADPAEMYDCIWQWPGYWRSYTKKITIPVYYLLGAADSMWYFDQDFLDDLRESFRKLKPSVSLVSELILKAPHCVDLSFAALGTNMRILGWAMKAGRVAEAI